jgi:hypothetical protein
VSTLWTPSGEHPVPRATPEATSGGSGRSRDTEAPPRRERPGTPTRPEGQREPTPEEIREAEAEINAVREEILSAPAEAVISNHALGLWQLAALHLSAEPPNLPQAQLAIDALAALLDGLRGRLGEDEKTLADGLTQMRMAFVQIANAERAKQATG